MFVTSSPFIPEDELRYTSTGKSAKSLPILVWSMVILMRRCQLSSQSGGGQVVVDVVLVVVVLVEVVDVVDVVVQFSTSV